MKFLIGKYIIRQIFIYNGCKPLALGVEGFEKLMKVLVGIYGFEQSWELFYYYDRLYKEHTYTK